MATTMIRYAGKAYAPTENYFSEDESDYWIVFQKDTVVGVFEHMKDAADRMKQLSGGDTKYFMRPYRVVNND